MVDPELAQFIESMKESGFSDEETRKKLLDAGWDPKEVNEALGTGSAAAVPVAVAASAAAVPVVVAASAAKPAASPGMAYQGIGIRFAAKVIDSIVLFFVFVIGGIPFVLIFGGLDGVGFDQEGPLSFLLNMIFIVVGFAYFVIMEGSRGQTVGKMVLGIKVVKEDGSPCDVHAALIRNALRIVDGIMVYLVGVILIATSATKQRLGDRVAKTVVVKT